AGPGRCLAGPRRRVSRIMATGFRGCYHERRPPPLKRHETQGRRQEPRPVCRHRGTRIRDERPETGGRILVSCLVSLVSCLLHESLAVQADEPPAPAPAAAPAEDRPTYIILDAPDSIPELLRRLGRPDFVLRKGTEEGPGPGPLAPGPSATGVTRVEV